MNVDRRNRPPAPAWLGRWLEPFYRKAIADRNRRFDAGEGVHSLDVPVISVGNLSVGGTGKTPTVIRLIELARASGHRPCVAMRGYKRGTAAQSDEQAEYLDRFPGLEVVAQPDRIAGLRTLLDRDPNAFDCVILDDGLQHRQIARDLEIVLLDATRDVFSDHCLPHGWLREPVESLHRADIILFTHAEAVPREALNIMLRRAREFAPQATICIAHHVWKALRVGNDERAPDWLKGKSVAVACGIGHPAAFIAAVERAGATVPVRMVRRDHHPWTSADLKTLHQARVDAIVTTAKDWSKLAPLAQGWTGPVFVRPVLEMTITEGEAEFARRVHHTLTTPVPPPSPLDAPPATVSA